MTARMLLIGIVLLTLLGPPFVMGGGSARAEEESSDKLASQGNVRALSLEVTALQMMHQFQFTLPQLQKLRQCAKETAARGQARQKGDASEEYRDKLVELRKALLEGDDDDLIDELSDELDEMRLDENPPLADEIKLTPGARRRAPELLRLLKANQYAAYAGLLIDLVDPLDLLQASLPKVRELESADWREKRAQIADEIGRLVGGVDAAKEENLKKTVAALLTRARRMSDEDFETQHTQLEEEARRIIGPIGPAEVIRNEIEYSIGELLSNARLPAALAARLQL